MIKDVDARAQHCELYMSGGSAHRPIASSICPGPSHSLCMYENSPSSSPARVHVHVVHGPHDQACGVPGGQQVKIRHREGEIC